MNEFDREQAAYSALKNFMDDAREVARLFQLADLDVPRPIGRVLGTSAHKGQNRSLLLAEATRPNDWEPDWFWVDAKALSLNTLVLSILREAKTTIEPKEMIDRVAKYQPCAPAGSIYNVGPRLAKAGKIKRDGGWLLENESLAPVLYGGKAWGPKNVFEKQDIAAHRRQMIVDTLASEPDGLMIVQLVKKLKARDEWDTPITKEHIKIDLRVMSKRGLVRRSGGTSKKWGLTEAI